MADCLKQAQNFMLICEQALSDIDNACPVTKTSSLAKIQRAAKSNRARAIYRAAQEAIITVDNQNDFARQLYLLTHLLSQYQSGVTELENIEGPAERQEISFKNEPEHVSKNIQTEHQGEALTNEALQNHAIIALCSSLHLAEEKERPALSNLISLATQQKNSFSQNIVVPNDIKKAQIETKGIIRKKIITRDDKKYSLETIMPDLIHDGLHHARHAGLTLSLSYDVNKTQLSSSELKDITPRLKKWLKQLVLHIASQPEAQSLAHIDISARNKQISFTTKTSPLADTVLTYARDTALVSQQYNSSANMLELAVCLRDKTEKARSETKTIPMDAGLSQRLDALMSAENDAMTPTPLIAL